MSWKTAWNWTFLEKEHLIILFLCVVFFTRGFFNSKKWAVLWPSMVPTYRKVLESWLRKTNLRRKIFFYFAIGEGSWNKVKNRRIYHCENEVKTGNKLTWGGFETRRETELVELSLRIGLNDKEILSLLVPNHSVVTCITACKRCAKNASVQEETPQRLGWGGRLWASCSSRSWTNAGILMVTPAVLGCKTP